MLVLFLSILENDDERRRFTNIYEQYHEKNGTGRNAYLAGTA